MGVFLSRSSGTLFRLRRPALWAVAWLQVANLAFFVADGALQFWVGPTLTLPALQKYAPLLHTLAAISCPPRKPCSSISSDRTKPAK